MVRNVMVKAVTTPQSDKPVDLLSAGLQLKLGTPLMQATQL